MNQITENDLLYLEIMEDLHANWQPHSGQLTVGKEFFNKGNIDTVFLQNGRKWGKSEFVIYFLWRHALLNPGSSCYYFCPFLKQAREIVWSERRLQSFGPNKYVHKIDNSDLRITFKNGSFIKIDGSDNYEAYRGTQPSLCIYDEFKDFYPQFHEGMAPNLAVKKAPLLIIGTPPRLDSKNYAQYTQLAEECKQRSNAIWMCRPTTDNPTISQEWLDAEKNKLLSRGEADVWFREYEGKLVAGGKRAVFPMLSRFTHVKDHNNLMQEIHKDRKKLEWFISMDPGTTTCFAILLGCINPYTKKIYLLDCIYETNQQKTSIMQIIPELFRKIDILYPNSDLNDDWIRVIDEAAAWANNEMLNQYNIYFQPTNKAHHKKEDGISLIKDILLHNMVLISDVCEPLLFEMENYICDDFGRFPKKNDHLIDCFRYLLGAANYDTNEMIHAKLLTSEKRAYKIEDDFNEFQNKHDWTKKFNI
jgi:hypothetical protein